MADRLKKTRAPRRDVEDRAALKLAGSPSHINASEARLLARTMPESHGKVITSGLLAEAGRGRDDRVTLLTDREAALLKARGGSGAVNPRTGLLEYDNDSGEGDGGPSDGGNTSSAGENTGGMDTGSPNSGVTGNEGPSSSAGGNSGSYADQYGVGFAGSLFGGRRGVRAGPNNQLGYDPTNRVSIDDVLGTPNGYRAPGYEDLSMRQYSPPDTFGRLFETYMYGPPRSYKTLGAAPGRYGGPTGRGPGVMGTMAAQLTGMPMSMAMNLGMHFDQAMSPGTRAASLAENQAQGSVNSGGNQGNHSVLDMDAKRAAMGGALPAGTASGAETADLMTSPGVNLGGQIYGATPAGQMAPTSEGRTTLTGLPTPVENLLADYIWRGRTGNGWGW